MVLNLNRALRKNSRGWQDGRMAGWQVKVKVTVSKARGTLCIFFIVQSDIKGKVVSIDT